MKKQSLALTLTLCMGLGAFTACTPSQMSANPTGVNQTAVQPGQTSALSLQAALANYHEVDASFSDTQRLARSGQFQTKLLGDILGDDNDSDSSSSGSLNLGVGVNAGVDASGSGSSSGSSGSGSGSGSLGVGVNAGVDANASGSGSNSSSGSGSLGLGVNAGVDASATGSGSSSNSGSGSGSGSGSLGVGVNAGVDANATSSGSSSNSGSGSGSLGVGVNAGVDANVDGSTNSTSNGTSGTGSQSGSVATAANLDANAMFNLVENSSSQYRDRFQSSGYLQANSNGGFDIDADRLETDLKAKLNVDAQLDSSVDNNDSGRVWAQIGADALARLSSRSYDTRNWSSDTQTMADGSVNSNFYTMFRNSSTERNVIMTDLNSDANTTFKLEERGSNFTRSAQRRSERQLDGSIRTMTSVTTNFTSGDKLEIFEDRYSSSVQGSGAGTGTFRLTRADGSQQSGDLRTMLTADGSLTSYLDSDSQDLMLREDAQGRGSLSLRGTDGWNGSWTNVDFNAMLNSMTQLSSRS